MVPQQIIYRDDSLVVVNKSCGISAIPGRGIMQDSLSEYLCRELGHKIYTVHRLDRDTSGVILFARTSAAHRYLSLQFEKRETEKVYWAVVAGEVKENLHINKPVYQFGSGRMGIDERGKPSLTECMVKKIFADATFLEVHPITGRRHQIRVHLYNAGHPILGDMVYGDQRPVGGVARLMLHAYQLRIKHPDGTMRTFTAQPDILWDEIILFYSK